MRCLTFACTFKYRAGAPWVKVLAVGDWAGVILPMVESTRPWWLVPPLAVGGTLMVTVVALLAVLLLQPAREARANGGDPDRDLALTFSSDRLPGGTTTAPIASRLKK